MPSRCVCELRGIDRRLRSQRRPPRWSAPAPRNRAPRRSARTRLARRATPGMRSRCNTSTSAFSTAQSSSAKASGTRSGRPRSAAQQQRAAQQPIGQIAIVDFHVPARRMSGGSIRLRGRACKTGAGSAQQQVGDQLAQFRAQPHWQIPARTTTIAAWTCGPPCARGFPRPAICRAKAHPQARQRDRAVARAPRGPAHERARHERHDQG